MESKWKIIETAPCPYQNIGNGLAVVDIEQLIKGTQSLIDKAREDALKEVLDYAVNSGMKGKYIVSHIQVLLKEKKV